MSGISSGDPAKFLKDSFGAGARGLCAIEAHGKTSRQSEIARSKTLLFFIFPILV
jgi:hypothetical protein